MRYEDLSAKWKKEALRIETASIEQWIKEQADSLGVEPWSILEDQDVLTDALEHHQYEIILGADGKEILRRVYQ